MSTAEVGLRTAGHAAGNPLSIAKAATTAVSPDRAAGERANASPTDSTLWWLTQTGLSLMVAVDGPRLSVSPYDLTPSRDISREAEAPIPGRVFAGATGVRRRQSRLLDATKVAAVRHRHSQVFYSTVPPDIRPVGVERRPGFTTGDRVTDEVDRQATRARPTRKVEMDRESYGTDSGTFAARASFDVLERRLMAEPGIERVTRADP